MHRFLVKGGAAIGDIVALDREEAHHAVHVLRVAPGEIVALIDGTRAYQGAVVTTQKSVTVRIESELPANRSPIDITLYQGIARNDKMDFIVQKAVELGVSAFVPVRMSRCVARIDDSHKKIAHWQGIAQSASKQCARAHSMSIHEPIAIADIHAHALTLIAWEGGGAHIKDVLSGRVVREIGVVIGPEGGMTQDEIKAINGTPVTLGPRILRTETAGIALITILQYALGDMG